MSDGKKYTQQFDANAGSPADFDSLFRFENGELIAKKRIKMRSSRRRIAAMALSAAAVTAAAYFGLSYLSSSGISDSGIAELAEISETTSALEEHLESSHEYLLSELIKPTDIYAPLGIAAADDTSSAEYLLEDADIILRCRIITKEYLTESTDSDFIRYEAAAIEYYYADGITSDGSSVTFPNDSLYVTAPAAESSLSEMQVGDEYIILLSASEENGDVQCRQSAMPIRRTAEGWLIDTGYTELCENTYPVASDIEDPSGRTFCLELSDDAMQEKVMSALDNSSLRFYHHYDNTASSAEISSVTVSDDETKAAYSSDAGTVYPFSEIFGSMASDIFERIFTETEDGGTVLVLDNKEYFSLYPRITGTVTYSGQSANGDNAVMIMTSDNSARTIIFTGLSEIMAAEGTETDEETLIGSCDSSPIYIRCYDDMGQLMNIDINE